MKAKPTLLKNLQGENNFKDNPFKEKSLTSDNQNRETKPSSPSPLDLLNLQENTILNSGNTMNEMSSKPITPMVFNKITPLIISNPSEEKLESNNTSGEKIENVNPGNINKKYSTFRLHRVDNIESSGNVKKEDLTVVNEYSAGGIVFNENSCAAIISRINRKGKEEWCFPKGHLEDGENPEQAAIREVQEETGLKTKIVNLLGIVDYNFSVGEYEIHKKVHHYALEKLDGSFSKRIDPDNEVNRILWVPFSKLQNVLTYENERKLARLFLSVM